MPHRGFRPSSREQASADAVAASELLEVLWGRGQESAASGTVSPSQLRALLVIERQEGTNLRALGEALGSSAPSVSRLCDRMEAMGLLQRAPSPTSRREVELRLSPRGRALLEEYRALRAAELNAVLERMDPAALASLAEGLAAFHAAATERLSPRGETAATPLRGDVADSA
ncbi:MarR family winged helix-turn-helix transcriptional regulator [Streptomyces fimicarius]|uniref:MarR family winged helix-turn-helix transcriptional regulator n=1 Tax=Streptomyces caviscabies TaxID=90079 RepID=A0ABW2MFL6_9ACTN|nr:MULTISPECIES: MarR family transcriptional regulator [Streptomyces]MCL6288619.1 MarR family transcriptional regulator [Streptomyces sp. 43Y-GA-1]MCX4713145.1 MarR family transcriptional regulator [Streptomyces griseus]MDX2668317.1 MarR family transcriptional regulator [Streptomyces sp. NRRL_ISP-5395]MDX3339185.1 MarR family transcriptional regulator [Streptomyces sp. ME02-6979.5a]MDX3502389.1 MarR family transcriptional regulator [Streptomyces sp. ATCC51928]